MLMKASKWIRGGALILCAAAVALAAGDAYTWTAGGSNDNYSNGDNWFAISCGYPCAAYPQETTHTATFNNSVSAPWTCYKDVAETIGTLTVKEDTTFAGPNRLTANRLVLDGAPAAFVVEISKGEVWGNP
jgi:hypothetical protein